MFRKLILAASAVALAGGSLVAIATTSASAAGITVTAGHGSSLNCTNMTEAIKLAPPLKDDWVKSQHSGDSDTNVKNIPGMTFAPPPPENVKATATSSTCHASTATDGAHSLPILSMSAKLALDPAHPGSDPGSCVELATNTDPGTARYNGTIKYTTTGGKITGTTITDALIQQIPANTPGYTYGGFKVSGGTISGSFAGSTDFQVAASVDSATATIFLYEIGGVVPTSSHPAAYSACQPSLKIKPATASKPEVVTLVKPKGLKKITTTPSENNATASR